MGSCGTAGNNIRSETKEVEEGAEINEKDEGVKEMGLDKECPPNSSRSSVDDRLFVNSLQQDLTCFFRILHLVLVDEIKKRPVPQCWYCRRWARIAGNVVVMLSRRSEGAAAQAVPNAKKKKKT
jgi:hypothetical protein